MTENVGLDLLRKKDKSRSFKKDLNHELFTVGISSLYSTELKLLCLTLVQICISAIKEIWTILCVKFSRSFGFLSLNEFQNRINSHKNVYLKSFKFLNIIAIYTILFLRERLYLNFLIGYFIWKMCTQKLEWILKMCVKTKQSKGLFFDRVRIASMFFNGWNFYLQAINKLDVTLSIISPQESGSLGRMHYWKAIYTHHWNCQKAVKIICWSNTEIFNKTK